MNLSLNKYTVKTINIPSIIRKTIYILSEYYNKKYISIYSGIFRYFKYRNYQYTIVKTNEWHKYKTSDTVFIFGAGPSINDITESQYEHIKKHDSFGLSYFFLAEFPTTYYCLSMEGGGKNRNMFSDRYREIYEYTLWLLPRKALFRMIHPRITPEYFPVNSKVSMFDLPSAICLDSRSFTKDDFELSLFYRGTLSLALDIVNRIGYKNIVLMGVDLHTYKHFFDELHVTKNYCEEYAQVHKKNKVFESMIPKKGKGQPMDEYFYSVNELYFKPKGVNLYVGNKNNMISPCIPLYPKFE